MMPAVGGQFAVIRAAFGRRMAFFSVASVTMTVQAGAVGILALLCAGAVPRVRLGRPDARFGHGGRARGARAVYAINVAGVRLSARVLRANVAVKLAAIAAIVAIAAASTQPAPPRSFEVGEWPGFGAFVYALIPTLFSTAGSSRSCGPPARSAIRSATSPSGS